MPAELIDEPVGIKFVSTARRTRATVHVGETCNPVLTRQMLSGLTNLVHPHGPIDELKTFQQYVAAIRRFVAELAERGPSGPDRSWRHAGRRGQQPVAGRPTAHPDHFHLACTV